MKAILDKNEYYPGEVASLRVIYDNSNSKNPIHVFRVAIMRHISLDDKKNDDGVSK